MDVYARVSSCNRSGTRGIRETRVSKPSVTQFLYAISIRANIRLSFHKSLIYVRVISRNYTYIYFPKFLHIYISIYMCVYTYVRMYVRAYTCIYIYIYRHVYTYIDMYTYTYRFL